MRWRNRSKRLLHSSIFAGSAPVQKLHIRPGTIDRVHTT